jgi:hypothetical protein
MRACELSAWRHTYLYDTYIVVVVDVVAAELVVWVSADIFNQKGFTYKVVSEEVEEEKKKKLYMRWEFITHFTDR